MADAINPNMPYQRWLQTCQVVIDNGAALSDAVDLGGHTLVGIRMPAAWTAAVMTFQAADPTGAGAGTFYEVYDSDGNDREYTVTASDYIPVDPGLWLGVQHLKVRSGTAASPVNQGAERVVILLVRPL